LLTGCVCGFKVGLEELPLILIADADPEIDHFNRYLKLHTTVLSLHFYIDGFVNR
jgi:hypothetical protein